MTNSYSLFRKPLPDIILIHGMNNNSSSFVPLKEFFERSGHKVHFVTLPCHGENRLEARDFQEAFACFDRTMNSLTNSPYQVIAFSHGALYFQLWLQKRPDRRPIKQALLAPALFIRRQKKIETIFNLLPTFLILKSLAPKRFRRYQLLTVGEYRLLLDGMKIWQRQGAQFKIPTLILIDPADELVDAQLLKEKVKQSELVVFQLWPRPYSTKGIGRHHILFHPDYFEESDWQSFTKTIQTYLTAEV